MVEYHAYITTYSDPDLRYICVQYQDRIRVIENDKYDIELEAKCTRQKVQYNIYLSFFP